MNSDADFMRLALSEAEAAGSAQDVPVGAVIVRDAQVIASGRNDRESINRVDGHAELNAIRTASSLLGDRRLVGCTLYVTLEPCPMCAGAIVASRLERLVFGAWDPKTGACGSLYNIVEDPRLNHAVEVARGVLEQDCSRQLVEFFALRREIKPQA